MTQRHVYFFLPDNDDVYFDAPLVLAEGLLELGVPFCANRDYWQTSPGSSDTLFKRIDGFAHDDAAVVVIHDDWFYHFPQSTLKLVERPAPSGLFRRPRKYLLVYIDTWVGARSNSWSREFRDCDVILRTQLNARSSRPANMKPWVLGFTDRVVKAASGLPFNQRRRTVVRNFAYTHPFEHGVRKVFDQEIAPRLLQSFEVDSGTSNPDPSRMSEYDRLMWMQTHDKHNPDYFAQLGSSKLVAAFCGFLCPWNPADASVHFRGGRRYRLIAELHRLAGAPFKRAPRLIQWDSWRFWETLCAGAAALHLDLEEYGAALPVMPENWKHYIGFDLNSIEKDIERLASDEGALAEIARCGRQWALTHYSPRAMAQRFLAEIGLGGLASR